MSKHDIQNTPQDRIQYREYKIILQPQHFTTAQAFKDFWQIVKTTAKKFDVKVKEADEAFESHVREVLFFDTEDFALYRNILFSDSAQITKAAGLMGFPR